MIDYQYAKTDLIRAFETKRKLAERWNRFSKELNGDDFRPWADEIGFGNTEVFEVWMKDITKKNRMKLHEATKQLVTQFGQNVVAEVRLQICWLTSIAIKNIPL